MEIFLLNQNSIGYMTACLVSFLMGLYFITNKKKLKATIYLALWMFGSTLLYFGLFLEQTIYHPIAGYSLLVFYLYIPSLPFLILFAYEYPYNINHRESTLLFYVSMVLGILIYLHSVYTSFLTGPFFNFRQQAFINLHAHKYTSIYILSCFIWSLTVSLRKIPTLRRSGENFYGPQAFILFIVLAIGISGLNTVMQTIESIRSIWPVIFINGTLLAFFFLLISYLNHSREPSTFLVKIVGVSLLTVIMVTIVIGNITEYILEKDFIQRKQYAAMRTISTLGLKNYTNQETEIFYIAEHSSVNKEIRILFKKNSISMKNFINSETGIKNTDTPMKTVGQFKFRDIEGTQYIGLLILRENKLLEIGFDYKEYRIAKHNTAFVFSVVMLVVTLLMLVIYPIFFRVNLFHPLKNLLDGVRRVNQGDLNLKVPVYVEDEIGFLTHSFNRMTNSIHRAQTELGSINQSLNRFVPKEILKFLDKQSILDVKLGDQVEREMTVFFADIRNFTSLSEKMSPEENFNFLNSYLGRVSPVIRAKNGFIDKYIGDAIMALFPESPKDAVFAAIALQKEISSYNSHRQKTNYNPLQVGVGIHAGKLMLGTIGEELRMEGTVISDTVNLANRLEDLTKIYGAPILISETVKKAISESTIHFRFIGKVKPKGKSVKIKIYEVIDPDSTLSSRLNSIQIFEKAVVDMLRGKSKESIHGFKKVITVDPTDKPALVHLNSLQGKSFK